MFWLPSPPAGLHAKQQSNSRVQDMSELLQSLLNQALAISNRRSIGSLQRIVFYETLHIIQSFHHRDCDRCDLQSHYRLNRVFTAAAREALRAPAPPPCKGYPRQELKLWAPMIQSVKPVCVAKSRSTLLPFQSLYSTFFWRHLWFSLRLYSVG